MAAALKSANDLDAVHSKVLDLGWRLLQPHRFGQDDADHVGKLLHVAGFPRGSRVLDVGCGFGECANLMHAQRPDLSFVLLNFSGMQLAECPDGFERVQGDAHDLPFPSGTFDAVMFNAALGNMDAMVAIAEASRVLKPGGVLFLNELARIKGDNTEMERLLSFRAYPQESLIAFVQSMGFEDSYAEHPEIHREYLRDAMASADYEAAFSGTTPFLARFVKGPETPIAARHAPIFIRHERIALQVSGGKDSLATLYAMRPWWDRLCVYWLNTGDAFPETVALMNRIRADVPHFVEIAGRQKAIVAADGWPSDVVPQAYTSEGNFAFGPTPFKVQSRLSCCFRALMLPMQERMFEHGVTCIIRGKRSSEKDKSPSRTGTVLSGIETVYPIWDWSEEDVFAFLASDGIDLPDSYRYASHSLDCMSCSAWWGEGLSRFLEARYPAQHVEYVRRISLIKAAVAEHMNDCEV